MRGILLTTIVAAALIAGCAENSANGPGGTSPLTVPSNAEAASLFASAAGNIPDKYGIQMTIAKDGKSLMSAEAVFDEPKELGFFKIKMDPSLMEDASGGMGGAMFGSGEEIAFYSSPAGSAMVMDKTVILTPPDEENPMMAGATEEEGFGQLADPEAFLSELKNENITVNSVEATTLRGKPALKVNATFTDEDGPQSITIWLFQEPTRVARLEAVMPSNEEEDPQFAGATMTMDVLYDDEITVAIPEDLQRVLGLRYESDRSMFGGFGGGSGEEDDTETWTFQVDGAIALSDVEAEVRDGSGGTDAMDAPPAWSMKLSESPKTVDTLTVAFQDADGDGKVSMGDTLTIARGEGTEAMMVSLHDIVTGYRVTPGAGVLLSVLALLGALLVLRRGE